MTEGQLSRIFGCRQLDICEAKAAGKQLSPRSLVVSVLHALTPNDESRNHLAGRQQPAKQVAGMLVTVAIGV